MPRLRIEGWYPQNPGKEAEDVVFVSRGGGDGSRKT